jgi:hypothetical protein
MPPPSPSSEPSVPCADVHPPHTSSLGRVVRPSSPSSKSRVDRSLAFKAWARGRCYRCLGRDHQVSACRDSFRCIRCRRPGHRERQCHLQSSSASPHSDSPSQHLLQMCFVNRCRLRPTTVLIVLLVVVNVAPHMGHRPQIFILCLGLCWSHFAQISRSSSYA